jgi:hypothetical protein
MIYMDSRKFNPTHYRRNKYISYGNLGYPVALKLGSS